MKYNDNGTYKDIYVKSFDTLPVGTEVDYDGSVVPSGWTDTTDSWHTLNSIIKYKKSGNVVTVTGFSSNTITLSENDYTIVGTLPSGYRPGEQLNNVWNELGVAYSNTIRINTNGAIQLYSTKNTAYWVFTLTYVIDDKVIRKTSQYIEGGASLSNVYGTSDSNGYTQSYINSLTSNYEIKIISVTATTDANGFFTTGITKSSNFILGVSGPYDFLYKMYNENTRDVYTIKLQYWDEQAISNQNVTLNICYLSLINS